MISDCTTQRNLSERGRRQAVEIGNRFRSAGIRVAKVYSSQWCRCLETAELLALGDVRELPVLNSFYQRYTKEEEQTRSLRQWLLEQAMTTPLVLVTHQVKITALTGIFPSSGELVIVNREPNGDFSVAGTIETD
jgi:phosphohistidine phosphatase SixA